MPTKSFCILFQALEARLRTEVRVLISLPPKGTSGTLGEGGFCLLGKHNVGKTGGYWQSRGRLSRGRDNRYVSL